MDHPDLWPFDTTWMHAALDFDTMMTVPRKLCSKYSVDIEAAVPSFVQDGLRRLCGELDKSAHVLESTRPLLAQNIQSKLESRVHLHRLFSMYPEIANEPIEAPVFVLGLNRTGTTFLHRMLEASGNFWAPHVEEQFMLPTAEKIAEDGLYDAERLTSINSTLEGVMASFAGVHDISVGLAEEDMCAHSHSFHSLEYDVQCNLPAYAEWLDREALDETYAEHRKWMQFITWSRRRAGKVPRRWAMKMPWHVRSLPALLKAYPDALLVHTHRPPKDVAGSWCSLIERQQQRFTGTVDRMALGKQQIEAMGKTLLAGVHFRQSNPELASRWLDVQFDTLISAPEKAVAAVFAHAGCAFGSASRREVTSYITDVKAKRSGEKLHKYQLADYVGEDCAKNVAATPAFTEYKVTQASLNTEGSAPAVDGVPPFVKAAGFAVLTGFVAMYMAYFNAEASA